MSFARILLSLLLLGNLSLCQPAVPVDVETWPTQSFKTEPSFRPPVLDVTKSGAALEDGLLMITLLPVTNEVENAATIMTDTGDLIWNSPPGGYSNMVVSTLDSQPVLSFWNGTSLGYQGYGFISILDTTYTEIYRVCPDINVLAPLGTKFPCYIDIHESYITPQGTMLLTVYNITNADLTSINGTEDGWIYDNLFYEVDIKTNETLFRWSAYESGIPLSATKAVLDNVAGFGNGTLEAPFDFYHINSVQPVGLDYLVNSRHYWNTYLIDRNGTIKWEINGIDGGDFDIPEAHFTWQHMARVENVTETDAVLTYFNNFNGNEPYFNNSHPAEGLAFQLNLVDKTATVLKNLTDPDEPIFPIAAGSTTTLPNGNTLVSYGTYPSIKEFGPDGDVRMSIRFGVNETTNPAGFSSLAYRTYRQEWVGTPATPPVAVVDPDNELLYVSWNGATGITSWEILCGNSTEQSAVSLATIPSTGFETTYDLAGSSCGGFVQAAAYRDDVRLRSTGPISVSANGQRQSRR